jgi:hypothetical protein
MKLFIITPSVVYPQNGEYTSNYFTMMKVYAATKDQAVKIAWQYGGWMPAVEGESCLKATEEAATAHVVVAY